MTRNMTVTPLKYCSHSPIHPLLPLKITIDPEVNRSTQHSRAGIAPGYELDGSEIESRQWHTEGVCKQLHPTLPELRSFHKARPNSQFRVKYIRNNLIRLRISLTWNLSGTPEYGPTAPRSPFSLPTVLNLICDIPPLVIIRHSTVVRLLPLSTSHY
jgi:hypothetical protein